MVIHGLTIEGGGSPLLLGQQAFSFYTHAHICTTGGPRVLSLSQPAFTPMSRPSDSEASRVLSNLHTDLAWHLKSRLDDGSISTAELNILRQFLKDNGISAQPVAGTSFGDLVASLPDMDKIVQMPRRKVA